MTFRAFSHASKESQCWECQPRKSNVSSQTKKRAEDMKKDAYNRLEELEKKVDDLSVSYDFQQGEMNTLATDIETIANNLLTQAVEKEVERLFDEKIQLVQSIEERFAKKLATVNSRISHPVNKREKKPPTIESRTIPKRAIKKISQISQKNRVRMLRAVKYGKEYAGDFTARELQATVWHDISFSYATTLAQRGVELGFLAIVSKGIQGGKATVYTYADTTPE
tara:strand:- start:9051 stop:9722 length:672 start_codon:yes stop_codon:yes gene_type:complete